jgi:hypothetical protein
VGKYGHAISKEDLKNEIQKVFYKKKIQHSTLDSYWEYVDELFAVDLSGEQYTEDEVLRFAQQQNMKKTLLDASHKMVNHQDFLSIEVAGKTIPLSERIRQIEGIGSKTISWESLPTVTDLKPSITTWLVDEIIPFKAITIFHGSGGLGKSHIAWYLGNCVAEGQSFLNHSVKQCPVYYIDYENPSAVEVGDKNDPGFKMKFGDNKMIVFPSDLLPPKLDSKQWNIYKSFPPGLFIFDSLKSSHSLDPNSDKDMGLILDHMNELKALGNTVIALQHTPRSDETRSKGSKVITDQADLNIGLILQKEPGEDKEDEPEPNKPYVVFFGSRKEHKSRYRKHQIYIELSLGEIGAEKIFKVIGSPSDVLLPNVRQMLIEKIQAGDGFPNQNTFGKWIVERFNVKSHRAGKLIKLGDPKYWKGVEHKQGRVRSTEYRPAGFSKYDELGD